MCSLVVSRINSAEVKLDTIEEITIVEPREEEKEVEPKVKKVTWRDNPNECEPKKIRADNLECLSETKASSASSPTATQVKPATAYLVGCEQYRPLVAQYNWDVNVAMAVMQAESECNPNAQNTRDNHSQCIGSFGLFQLACFWMSNPTNPAGNVAKAFQIYSEQGWSPWGAYTSGAYLKYL